MNLNQIFYGTPFWLWCPIFFIFIILTTILLTWIFTRKFFSSIKYEVEPSSGILSITGTVFAVMIAMLTIDIVNQYEQAQKCILNEADYAGNIYLSSLNMPIKESKEITQLIKNYLQYVITKEIPAQDININRIDELRMQGFNYMVQISKITLKSKIPDVLKSQILSSIDSIYIQRRLRISTTETQLPGFLWTLLIGIWFILIVNVSLMDVKKIKSLYMFNILISLEIAMMVIFLIRYDLPFSGGKKLNIVPYEKVLSRIL